ncbi:macro domain-containing protein [Chitinophaga sp. Mgbs1]|uniref:Macro domain-containing protein n=1 Tax=Chitinophaga solisilvae TaxID=1233460 RepID=A0A3S1B291_9BACT|nr:macro domain-containing protein [Chitinophaga solisilvae]
MSVIFIQGDLFNHPGLHTYAHGCNCAGAMGKGIAVDFKLKFPDMYQEYKKRCRNGSFTLGSVYFYQSGPYSVFNIGTQKTWQTKAEMVAIETGLTTMLNIAAEHNIHKIGLPRIGAGLGRLSWEEVKETIIRLAENSPIELIVFEEFVKAPSV